ncbi:enoyl-CoA hydratase/isomerase family protein [Streptomyces sp. MMG1121]|uniref:enoyl-CoA hydratase/isomerase family protein n=1 Tax=Streptomyces sp. MMG1121 TaxID=1415544 RepID=UPI0006AF76D5|nr:enoyl-CoA hydratase/isomerase family protein [Streptomyces sp. MMG1121]KOV58127.1 enoyl-CoA hydratase [Streptomyces sp. MMG1121]
MASTAFAPPPFSEDVASHLTFSVEDSIATVVLQNPPQNRIDEQMATELAEAVKTMTRSDARAVLLRANGPDFSFGGAFVDWPDTDVHELRALFERYMSVFNEFERLPLPVVAAVQGLRFGGGFELALRADVIFAGESAHFGHPEQTLGLVTLLGGIHRVAESAGRARAAECALTSERVSASTMAAAGVVARVVPDGVLLKEATAFAQKLAQGPTRAHAAHKALLRAWAVGGIAAADEAMFDIALPLFETEDTRAGLASAVKAFTAGEPRPTLDFRGR